MNKKENNIDKLKELYSKYKEAKKDPRKRAGIKLLGYFIFFFILMLIASITSHMNNYESDNNVTTTTTKPVLTDKYKDKQKDLLTNKYYINYVININSNDYKISGSLENNILSGYLKSSEGIKEIVIKDNNIYEIVNDVENILETEFNKEFVSLNYIINLIKQNSAIISDSDNIKTYTYDIKDIAKFIVTTNEEMITEIKIEKDDSNYLLSFDN